MPKLWVLGLVVVALLVGLIAGRKMGTVSSVPIAKIRSVQDSVRLGLIDFSRFPKNHRIGYLGGGAFYDSTLVDSVIKINGGILDGRHFGPAEYRLMK